MKIKMKKFISCLNKDKAVIGKRYYFYDNIIDFIVDVKEGYNTVVNSNINTLTEINNKYKYYLFKAGNSGEYFPFLYPVDEDEELEPCVKACKDVVEYIEEDNRYLTFEELKQLWIENPYMILCQQFENYKDYFTITGFSDGSCQCFNGGNNSIYSFDTRILHNIENITTLDGKEFTTNNFPQFK